MQPVAAARASEQQGADTMSSPSPSRRLHLLRAHLTPDPAAVDLQTTTATAIDPALLEAAAEALAAGELDPREVSPEVVRELMVPEAGFLGYHGGNGLTETERLLADALHVPVERGGLLKDSMPMFDPSTGRMTDAALAELLKVICLFSHYLTVQLSLNLLIF